jgi:class 3 adenylate cyclase
MQISPIETRLAGTPLTRFLRELFGNSLHFPITNILLEMLVAGWRNYLFSPDGYLILFAGLIQAFFLSRWTGWKRLPGNLIGPAVYTLTETALEGWQFFRSPNHLLYWGVALIFGLMQAPRLKLKGFFFAGTILVEEIARASILMLMYYIFELKTNPVQTITLAAFFSDASHQFVTLVVLLLGLNIGLASLTAEWYLSLVKETSARLKTYSEWLLGRDLLGQIIQDPTALQLRRLERTILFMDIRGFTRWSETRSPEEVVHMLNLYYETAEAGLNQQPVIKFKFSADEVMAIFPTVDDGLQAAFNLRAQINELLGSHELGAGIGLHCGPMVEGLLGSQEVKFYDVIGDTVNTAKRIESSAESGEVLVSEAVRIALGATFRAGPKRQITVKGKEEPVSVYPLH